MEQEKLKEYVVAQIEREVKDLFKSHLNTIAELNQQHLAALCACQGKIDGESFRTLNYFDIAKMGYLRKQTLDSGNDTIRNIREMFEKINLDFKQ
jgi:hypothetical protein